MVYCSVTLSAQMGGTSRRPASLVNSSPLFTVFWTFLADLVLRGNKQRSIYSHYVCKDKYFSDQVRMF